jgi:Ser/Thr protein kinase RdoA (MazF antagonist)
MAQGLKLFSDVQRGEPAPEWVASQVRAIWGLPMAEVDLIVLSENATFRIAVDGSPRMVVRLSRPGYGDGPRHLESELAWMSALRRDVSAPVPSPVAASDGSMVQSLVGPDGDSWLAVAFEWVQGEVLEQRSDAASHYERLGALAGLFHDHSANWATPSGFSRFVWRVDDMVGPEARWGHWSAAPLSAAERKTLAAAEVKARMIVEGALGPDENPDLAHWGLIHADLRPTNVMATDSGLAVIDFDDAGYSYLLYDFAASLTFLEHRPEAHVMARAWLAGYRRVRPLSEAQLDAAVALSMLRRLTMLGWQQTHREDALPPDLWAENLPGTIAVARAFLEDSRWLVPRHDWA